MTNLNEIKERADTVANCSTCQSKAFGKHGKLVQQIVSSDLPALVEEVERLRGVLKPFAALLDSVALERCDDTDKLSWTVQTRYDGFDIGQDRFSFKQIALARQALTEGEGR